MLFPHGYTAKNRTDIRYLTTNTDTEFSTSVFRVLKNNQYRQLNNAYRKFSLFSVCTSVTSAIFIL